MGAEAYLPSDTAELAALRAASESCRGCALWRDATQTVFGAGRRGDQVMLVGEQPGDKEDRSGQPFVGPAGRILDEALEAAGIERARCYVTNAVKHFKHDLVGHRRLHKKPSARELAACRPWLTAEIEAVSPLVVVLLGASAAQSLLGPAFRVSRERGTVRPGPAGSALLATVHPSSVLRASSPTERAGRLEGLVQDLGLAARVLEGAGTGSGWRPGEEEGTGG